MTNLAVLMVDLQPVKIQLIDGLSDDLNAVATIASERYFLYFPDLFLFGCSG